MKPLPFLPLLIPILIPACTLGPDFSLPTFHPGASFKQPTYTSATPIPDSWWTLFNDPQLTRLTRQAISSNNDLAAARARRDTARALIGIDRARLFPRLDLASIRAISRTSGDNLFPPAPLENQSYRTTFNLAYDADLWGANRRRLEAATAQASAAEQLLDSQRLGIASEVARQYFILRALDTQEKILQQTISSRTEALTIQTSRQQAGLSDSLPATRATTEVELAKRDLANVQRQRGSAENALAILCGTPPSSLRISSSATPAQAPSIAPGLPATVLARRPDIRAAEQNLRAASARIGIAQAAFYPSISLTGSAGLDSLSAGNFLDWQSRVLSLGISRIAPLIDNGANTAAYQASLSNYQESLANYRQSLLIALREVEDALVDLQGLSRSRTALTAAEKSAQETRNLSQIRFEKGISSYLEVVESDRSVLSIRLALAELDGQQKISLTALIQALGGGWTGK